MEHKDADTGMIASECLANDEHCHADLNDEVITIQQSIFNQAPIVNNGEGCKEQIDEKPEAEDFLSTSSVKFMITMQDVIDLQCLGYSELHIRKLKPHEAAEILQTGTKAEPISG